MLIALENLAVTQSLFALTPSSSRSFWVKEILVQNEECVRQKF